MESRNEPLPVSTLGSRGKGPKRDEQYRQMWSELETFIMAHADTSPMHMQVLQCLQECKKPDDKSPKKGDKTGKDEKSELSQAEQSWKELDRFTKMTEREKQEINKTDTSVPQPKRQKMATDDHIIRGKS
ncbi:hypothetical protein KUTeg_020462 [Tegillarca granosa]|uniref:Uncharacterized protein n=1 Tax=Tegillarca granosa TaxID=220873 RepID=A0ABQ9E8H5_TEGGR|nr:hypothetical protein KUTeg_020462 [Tegillarca granosa]